MRMRAHLVRHTCWNCQASTFEGVRDSGVDAGAVEEEYAGLDIVELTTEEQWREAFPVMLELRTHLDEDTFVAMLREMAPQGYRLLAVREDWGDQGAGWHRLPDQPLLWSPHLGLRPDYYSYRALKGLWCGAAWPCRAHGTRARL